MHQKPADCMSLPVKITAESRYRYKIFSGKINIRCQIHLLIQGPCIQPAVSGKGF